MEQITRKQKSRPRHQTFISASYRSRRTVRRGGPHAAHTGPDNKMHKKALKQRLQLATIVMHTIQMHFRVKWTHLYSGHVGSDSCPTENWLTWRRIFEDAYNHEKRDKPLVYRDYLVGLIIDVENRMIRYL